MSDWKRVCSALRLSEGEAVGIKHEDIHIAIYMVNGEIFATDNVCPHAFALLSTGFLDEYIVECPLHGAMFDVRSGRCQTAAYKDIRAFNVEVRDGEVFVDIESGNAN